MGLRIGGSPFDIREISTEAELTRYLTDFGGYNVALDVTNPDETKILIHRSPFELFEALKRLLSTGSPLQGGNKPQNSKKSTHTLYLHSYSPAEASQIMTDAEYAEIQHDIMKLRASLLGLIPQKQKNSPAEMGQSNVDQPTNGEPIPKASVKGGSKQEHGTEKGEPKQSANAKAGGGHKSKDKQRRK